MEPTQKILAFFLSGIILATASAVINFEISSRAEFERAKKVYEKMAALPAKDKTLPAISLAPCAGELNPVCGTDNKTYLNICQAYLNKVQVKEFVPCDAIGAPQIIPSNTIFEKIGASILLGWSGFLELIK